MAWSTVALNKMLKTPTAPLSRIDVMVCADCLEGEGDVCWVPGCVFWSCDVPLVTSALQHCVAETVQPD